MLDISDKVNDETTIGAKRRRNLPIKGRVKPHIKEKSVQPRLLFAHILCILRTAHAQIFVRILRKVPKFYAQSLKKMRTVRVFFEKKNPG